MTTTSPNSPRIGIPWRTSEEQEQNNRPKLWNYEQAVRVAGGEPVVLALNRPEVLQQQLQTLDGFVLPGSPADVAPERYGRTNRGNSATADANRETTDFAILEHAFDSRKPVLAICYGCQSLNVYLGGTLIQDLRSETGTQLAHRKKDVSPDATEDPIHPVQFEENSRLANLSGDDRAKVNSSHHQAIEKPGRSLRITGHAPDGTVESVEWTGGDTWVTGVQWHPERMHDSLANRLFEELVVAARKVNRVSAGPRHPTAPGI